MLKKCISVQTPDFEKKLKKLGDKQKEKKILEKIKKLTDAENDHSLLPQLSNGAQLQSATDYYGKFLTASDHVYSLEVEGGALRALAIVKVKDDVKMFIWFFGGSHADYNKEIKMDKLKDKEGHLMDSKNNQDVIKAKLNEVRESLSLAPNFHHHHKTHH